MKNLSSIETCYNRNTRIWSEWHYRSRDEALIAFANHHIYENRLVTFPNPRRTQAVRHELVSALRDGAEVQEGSSAAEVRRVSDLVARLVSAP